MALSRVSVKQWHIILLGQVLTTGFAKERLDLTTGSADVGGHILNQPQHRHFNLLEHFDAFTGVEQCDVCGVVTSPHPITWHAEKRQLNIARARRHIDQQHIDIAPQRFSSSWLMAELAIGPRHTMGVLAELR
ncbi:MAG: hypothetical protein CM15mP74_21410 [Halieaceae bacterium]|nr:MAG: hypothetical protein CM15mP74_21410 [Halieaceae bacterium]